MHWRVMFFLVQEKLECWHQLTCQFSTWKSPVLCSFDRDNSMYEQQTWMLTTGLLNRNTGCQCCSVRCSSVSERHFEFSKVENFNFRSGSEAQYASSCQISWRSVETVCRRRKKWVGKKGQKPQNLQKWVLGAVIGSLKVIGNVIIIRPHVHDF